jgi:diguanylate cyclase (GGDEF)-like protein
VRLELARLARDAAHPSSVLMFDLDHFKQINDRHGHAAGDAVLQHVTGLVGQEVRQTDSVGRLGGEEFGVLLVGSGLAEAMVFAERLRYRIASTPISVDCAGVGVTVSIGVTTLNAEDAAAETVLARADQAMYRAKRNGRNRAVAEPAPSC